MPSDFSRRSFLKLSALALSSALAGRVYPFDRAFAAAADFQMLVLGDSIMWGQGLQGSNKFWYLIQEWLEREVYRNARRVRTHVEAHSGATITELKRDRRKYIDPLRKFDGEVNIGTPTIMQQVKNAAAHYRSEGVPAEAVDLILLDGGINDVSVTQLLTPIRLNPNFFLYIEKHCYEDMLGLLKETADAFPNARIVVAGYYPIVSAKTDPAEVCELVKAVVGLDKFEDWINRIARILRLEKRLDLCQTSADEALVNSLRLKSALWHQRSNERLQAAVDKLNADKPAASNPAAFGDFPGGSPQTVPPAPAGKRAFFAPVVFDPENSYAGGASYLWQYDQKSEEIIDGEKVSRDILKDSANCPDVRKFQAENDAMSNDQVFAWRAGHCNCRDLRYKGFNLLKCYIAGTGHPNVEGAKEYARAIKFQLTGGDSRYAR